MKSWEMKIRGIMTSVVLKKHRMMISMTLKTSNDDIHDVETPWNNMNPNDENPLDDDTMRFLAALGMTGSIEGGRGGNSGCHSERSEESL